jgi:transcriptional regulator with XRE-family HTH domain
MEDMIQLAEMRTVLAANVRRLRLSQKLTQQQFAERVGISRVMINRVEAGQTSVSAEVLFAIADALGVATDQLRQVS